MSSTSKVRRDLQLCQAPGALLKVLKAAIESDNIDLSVFGAAMQRCGQGRWWDALQETRDLQIAYRPLAPISRNIYITALTKAVRGEGGFGAVPERREQLLGLARQAWSDTGTRVDGLSWTIGANATLRLCAVALDEAALTWAEELWESAASRRACDDMMFHLFLSCQETYCRTARVDDELSRALKTKRWEVNVVLLGALMNAAAERRDWERAEHFWHTLVNDFGVVPNGIAYQSRAKAHMLSGRPHVAADLVDDMLANRIPLDSDHAEMSCQALLVVYHSSLAQRDLQRLQAGFQRGRSVVSAASARQRRTWRKLQAVASQIQLVPASVGLDKVLVEWTAQRSVMSEWKGCTTGINYIPRMSKGVRKDPAPRKPKRKR